MRLQPINPKKATIEEEEKRISVPHQFVPEWLSHIDDEIQVFCVPLLWARAVPLPTGYELEAWYLWSSADPRRDWVTDPLAVIENDGGGNAFYLRNMMYVAKVTTANRQCKVTCAGLFGQLMERSGSKIWLTHERHSLGILTDFAYQTGYGRMKLE